MIFFNSFKNWLDLAHLRIRWKLQCNGKSWRDMIEKRLGEGVFTYDFTIIFLFVG